MISEFTVSFNNPDLASKIGKSLKDYGVVIIEDVFALNECESFMTEMVDCLEKLSDGFDSKNYESTWKEGNLPPMMRSGLFHGLMGNIPLVIEIRSSERVQKVFQAAYSELRGESVTEFVSSLDGINIRPPFKPFHDSSVKDWAHLDLSLKDQMFECIQGQVVLTSTSASFLCSPKSHLVYEKILDIQGDGADLFFLTHEKYDKHTAVIESVGGVFQIPLYARPGSIILWLSSTVHSAKIQSDPEGFHLELLKGKWTNWRGVVYTCLRTKKEVSLEHMIGLQNAFDNNRLTNHYGDKVFEKIPIQSKSVVYSEKMSKLIGDPKLAYSIVPKQSNERWERLIGRSKEQ
jgi:hypothetical protein